MNKRTQYILIAIGALIIALIAWYFKSIVVYIIIAAVLATMGRPITRALQKVKIWKIRFNASFSAFLTLLIIILFILGLFVFMIPLLAGKFKDLANVDFMALLMQLEVPANKISMLISGQPVSFSDDSMVELARTKFFSFFRVSKVTDLFGTVAGTVGSVMVGLFSVLFITFFFLREDDMFRNGLLVLTPTGFEDRVSRSMDKVTYLLRRYFNGLLLEIILVMVLITIGLLIVGLDFSDALVIGLFCGVFNIIPYLGPWIGAAVGLLIGLALNVNADFMAQTLPLLAFMTVVFVLVQFIDNNFFQPLIYSSTVKAHPLEIFLVIMAAGSMAGVTGMILAIPVYTIIRVFAGEFLSGIKVVRKLTEKMEEPIEEKDIHV